MRRTILKRLISTLFILSIAIAAGGFTAFAQGKGRGNGKGNGGRGERPRQQAPQISPQQRNGRQERGGKWAMQNAQRNDQRNRSDRQRPEWSRQQMPVRQERPNYGQQRGYIVRQERDQKRSKGQREWNDRREIMQRDRSEARSRKGRGETPYIPRPAWNDRVRRDDQRRNQRRSGDRYDRQVYAPYYGRGYDGYNGYNGYKNYGQYRKAQVHERNAIRKEQREFEKYSDRYWRTYGSYYDDRYDRWGRRDRDDRRDRRDWFLRNVIRDRVYYDYSYVPRYYPYYYGTPYRLTYFGYPYDRYPYYDQISYVNIPLYGSYYSDPYYYDDYAYGPTYAGYGVPTSGYQQLGSILANVPIGELIYEFTGNSIAGEILSGFLSQAYNQGYLNGQYARSNGYADRYYDPYTYNTGYYDVYSANLAENRRIFSEGYELGYRDAIESRRIYDPYADRSPDLVSLLIGSTYAGI